MKPATKLALRRRVLMTLRAILWHADEWLHRQELAHRLQREMLEIREDLAATQAPAQRANRAGMLRAPAPKTETFQQWEARRSGIAPIAKQSRRRGVSAANFDRSFVQ